MEQLEPFAGDLTSPVVDSLLHEPSSINTSGCWGETSLLPEQLPSHVKFYYTPKKIKQK